MSNHTISTKEIERIAVVENEVKSLKENNTSDHKRLFKSFESMEKHIIDFITSASDKYATKVEVERVDTKFELYKKQGLGWLKHKNILTAQYVAIIILAATLLVSCQTNIGG